MRDSIYRAQYGSYDRVISESCTRQNDLRLRRMGSRQISDRAHVYHLEQVEVGGSGGRSPQIGKKAMRYHTLRPPSPHHTRILPAPVHIQKACPGHRSKGMDTET